MFNSVKFFAKLSWFVVFLPIAEGSEIGAERIKKLALMQCAIIVETKKIESANRVRLVNEFRLEANLDAYISGDSTIREAVRHGLCVPLLLDSDGFSSLLSEKQEVARAAALAAEQQKNVSDGLQKAESLKAKIEVCNLEFAKFDPKFQSDNQIVMWRKAFQGNKRANCRLDVSGKNIAALVQIKGESKKLEFRPVKFTTVGAPHLTGSLLDASRKLTKKDTKKIESIELLIDGFPEYGSDSCTFCIWPEGEQIVKPIYTKN